MSAYLGGPPMPPAELQKAAEQERARRAAATKASIQAGRVSQERADYDDVIWSNIVHFFRRWSGDQRSPQGWLPADREIMAKSARATLAFMVRQFDGSTKAAEIAKLRQLRDITYALEFPLLYSRDYPMPLRPQRRAAA
ncbi:hypothetical protein NUH86_01555 [Sphingobium sp. JS3065]|uniref:hypothetical protein n=1 Tax=Sphingobium sp. JS3065 TaxID=2970925 RepID=UPI00226442AA|nr:hypothetical protein [Sphingobium sp. JS3065]UZW55516.1 hypothetical protein NUH86_01555 [Sphingobium sp. JS3065]